MVVTTRDILLAGIFLIVFTGLFTKSSAQIYDEYPRNKSGVFECYDCNSEYDPRCGDPFNNYSIASVNCYKQKIPEHLLNPELYPNHTMQPKVCRKIIQKVQKNKTRIIRECGYLEDSHDDKKCYKRTGTKDVDIWYCACTTSLCNQGSAMVPPVFSLSLTMFTLSFISIRL